MPMALLDLPGQRLGELARKLDALTLKERCLLVAAALLVLLYGWNLFYLEPLEAERRRLVGEQEALIEEISRFDQLTAEWAAAFSKDADVEANRRLQALTVEKTAIDAEIAKRAGRMVSPEQMAGVLRDVILGMEGLEFVGLEGLPVTRLGVPVGDGAANSPSAGAAAEDGLRSAWRHGVRLRFSGSYPAIATYLRQLETLPHGFFWDRLELDAKDHPRIDATLEIHTVSLDKGWIGV
jgi:MSHA biogenesis protein MshJ